MSNNALSCLLKPVYLQQNLLSFPAAADVIVGRTVHEIFSKIGTNCSVVRKLMKNKYTRDLKYTSLINMVIVIQLDKFISYRRFISLTSTGRLNDIQKNQEQTNIFLKDTFKIWWTK